MDDGGKRGSGASPTRSVLAAACALVGLAFLPASAAAVSFGAPTNFAAGDGPFSVAAGEFNGDSHPDLAVANYGDDDVSILLGAAGGSFSAPTNVTVGDMPITVAVGEFNGDSDPDLAVTNSGDNNVSILLGAAGGSFSGATNFAAGASPEGVAVGEFNGDSDPDLAVANSFSDNVSILLGAAGGSFSGPTDFAAGSFPGSVAVGEFNGDSHPDLAVTDHANVSILLGAAGGNFSAPTSFPATQPSFVAVGEFNGDSDPDLAVANSFTNTVQILLGAAGGSFTGPTDFPTGATPYSIAVGEFNGDSHPDLAVANFNGPGVSILLGSGGGAFSAETHFLAGANPVSVVIGEFNGDSRPDLAAANQNSANVSILLGQFEPTISTQASAPVTIGQAISDQATLAGGSSATGTITFRAFGPDDAKCFKAPAYTSPPVLVSGNGSYQSPDFTPTRAGTYRWTTSYSGDASNTAAGGACNAPNESVAVAKATPSLTTSASADVVIGGTVHDTATLGGGYSVTGQLTFRLYGPGDASCSNPPAYTSPPVTVSGNGSYRSPDFTATPAGTYRWIASFSGDANNSPAAGVCSDANEAVTVAPDPTVAAIRVTGVALDRRNGTATLTVETTVPGRVRIEATKKVKGLGSVELTQAGEAELEVIARSKAAKKLRRTGHVRVNARATLARKATAIMPASKLEARRKLRLRLG